MKTKIKALVALSVAVTLLACNSANDGGNDTDGTPELVQQDIIYRIDTLKMDGFVVYDNKIEGRRPAVLVIPEWWGLNDYAKRRANELAELGYIAMAVDMYGNGQRGADPQAAGALATPFYQNPALAKERFEAALNQLKSYKQTDTTKIGAMGYCFGGAVVLNVARLGQDLKGVVSFHGNLAGVPADKEKLTANVLVLHGEDDKFVTAEEVAGFKVEMDSVGIPYTFKSYAGSTHAFTNPDATANGEKFQIPIAYNEAADKAAHAEMRAFFAELFK